MRRLSMLLVMGYAVTFLFSCAPFPKPTSVHCLKLDGMVKGELEFSVNEARPVSDSKKKIYPRNYVIQVFEDKTLTNLLNTVYLARTKDWKVIITLNPVNTNYCIVAHKDPPFRGFKQVGWSQENIFPVAGLVPPKPGSYYASTSTSISASISNSTSISFPRLAPITTKNGNGGNGVKVLID